MSEAEERSHHQRRRASRRAQILDGAARVFARKGFHGATTKEIAHAADVSEGTIYNYFDSKEDLLLHMMPLLRAEEQRSMDLAPDEAEGALSVELRELVEDVLVARQTFAVQNMSLLRAVISQILVDRDFANRYYEQILAPTLQLVETHLQARIDRGEIRPVDVPLFARHLVAASLGLFELLFLDDPVLTEKWGSTEMVERLTSFFLDGVQPTGQEREPNDA
jgi:AcrR family transcriptional regulator